MQLAQFGAGVDAELFVEQLLDPAVGGKRFRLAALAGEGGHQLGPEPLAPGVGGGQRLQFGDHRVALELEFRLHPGLDGVEPFVGQPTGLLAVQRVRGDVEQGLAAPDVQGGVEQAEGAFVLAGAQCGRTLVRSSVKRWTSNSSGSTASR